MENNTKTLFLWFLPLVAFILIVMQVASEGTSQENTLPLLDIGEVTDWAASRTGRVPSEISRKQPKREFELRIHTGARYRIETVGTTQVFIALMKNSSTRIDLDVCRGRQYSPDLVNQVIECDLSPGIYRLRVTHARPGGIGEFHVRLTAIGPVTADSANDQRLLTESKTAPQFVAQLGHLGTINDAALSANGRLLVTGGVDYVAVLWDVESRREIRRFFGHTASVTAVAVSADGRHLVTASDDGTACIWDASDGRLLRTLPSFPRSRQVRFSPDGQRVYCLDSNGGNRQAQLRCFAVATGEEGPSLRLGESRARSFAFASSMAESVYVAHEDGRVRVWDLRSVKMLGELAGVVADADMMAVSADGRTILAGTKTGQVRLWPDHRQGGSIELDLTGGTPRTLIGLRLTATGAFAIAREERRASIWRISEGQRPGGSPPPEFAGRALSATACAFTPDGQELRTMTTTITRQTPWPWELKEPRIWRWSPSDGTLLGTWDGIPGLSADGRPIPEIEAGDFAGAIDPQGKPLGFFGGLGGAVGLKNAYAVSSDGRLVAACDTVNRVGLNQDRVLQHVFYDEDYYDNHPSERRLLSDGNDVGKGRRAQQFSNLAFSPNDGGRRLLTADLAYNLRIWDTRTFAELKHFSGHQNLVSAVSFSPDGSLVLSGSWDNTVRLWHAETAQEVRRFLGHTDYVAGVGFSPDGKRIVTASWDGTTRIWQTETGREVCRLISTVDGKGLVVTPDGRFDTQDLEDVQCFAWTFPDDPLRPLAPEVFLRDYYEPGLLARVLAGEEFPLISPLAALNRVQPQIESLSIERGRDAVHALVTVRVSGGEGRRGSGLQTTGAFDLRLFRDGQLVGQRPPSAAEAAMPTVVSPEARTEWRRKTLVCKPEQSVEVSFDVQLPVLRAGETIEFSAYAFNEDRVKSVTKRASYLIPNGLPTRRPRAYVVSVGINAYETPSWDLQFAANDAIEFERAIRQRLSQLGEYDVASTALTSRYEPGSLRLQTLTATKANVRMLLEALAGQCDSPDLLSTLPGDARNFRHATPDDVLILFYAGHGFTGPDGTFYFFPYDIGADKHFLDEAVLDKAISSNELSLWLRDVDVGRAVMIIDACHSAGAVKGRGFKIGPFGSRGLGQLAYDKGMQVLAASQASQVAVEISDFGHGLLTYALLKAFEKRNAGDGEMELTLTQWLRWSQENAGPIYRSLLEREVQQLGQRLVRVAPSKSHSKAGVRLTGAELRQLLTLPVQEPVLFDFMKLPEKIRLDQ